ncbi:MAG: pyridoxamine 5'-phosphate oxidase-related FMN-binding protein [Candidatus Scalindua rubra]|uniref:Pyridoxamine 5'-phosphate oxidase-related FMN-binding protein n=1 Tax=Candidatus Scalindua rubra TaxID=1872076 RepID=A0A1E3XAQ6_9BACT|nr:MAG: pyridoxamine 5'-phosphate oxidase-related FMN-binding protein [Candidatus Scalindua rubra]
MIKIPEKIREFLSDVDISYVATSNKNGVPHIAIVKDIGIINDGEHIVFKSWFCVKSLENLAENSSVAVSTYNMKKEIGYQFIGKLVSQDIEAVLNGYAPEIESKEAEIPQTEYKLKIKVEIILELHLGTHTDKSIV